MSTHLLACQSSRGFRLRYLKWPPEQHSTDQRCGAATNFRTVVFPLGMGDLANSPSLSGSLASSSVLPSISLAAILGLATSAFRGLVCSAFLGWPPPDSQRLLNMFCKTASNLALRNLLQPNGARSLTLLLKQPNLVLPWPRKSLGFIRP